MTPEEAMALARERAAAHGDEVDLPTLAARPVDGVSLERLMEWATIEPDPDLVYSTRSWGAPITWVKQGLVHTLRQYTGQLLAQESRFNLQLMVYLSQQTDRIARLEEELTMLRAETDDP